MSVAVRFARFTPSQEFSWASLMDSDWCVVDVTSVFIVLLLLSCLPASWFNHLLYSFFHGLPGLLFTLLLVIKL